MLKRIVLSFVGIVLLTSAGLIIAQERSRGSGGPTRAEAPSIENTPLAKSDAEEKILSVLDEMGKDRSRRYLSVSLSDGRLLRQLTEAAGAKRVIEIGTSTGYSGLWFTLALRSTGGKLTTHEIDPGRAGIARDNFKRAGVDDLVTVVVGDAHEAVKQYKDPIDVVFLDADKDGYIDYLNKLLPLVRPGGLILAHNMRRPSPDPRYIEAVTKNPQLDTSFLLMDGAGVGVTLKKRKTVRFEGKQWITDLAKEVTVEEFKGKTALHVRGEEQSYVYLPGTDFQDGTIEVDVAARVFSGIGFRGRQDGTRIEKVYFRPFNAGTAKHQNTVQYAVTGRGDGTWGYLRKNFPGKYETGADIKVFEWFHAKLVIRGTEVKVYVNDGEAPVLVVDNMLDGISQGTVGVWGWDSYFANFRYTPSE